MYFKTDRYKHTLHVQCVHMLRPILQLAEPANGFLHIWRFTLSLFFPIFFVRQELLMLIERIGSKHNFAISKNACSLPARCLDSFQEKEKKILVNREKGPHWNKHSDFNSGHKSLSTLTLINWSSSNPPELLWVSRIKDNDDISRL